MYQFLSGKQSVTIRLPNMYSVCVLIDCVAQPIKHTHTHTYAHTRTHSFGFIQCNMIMYIDI